MDIEKMRKLADAANNGNFIAAIEPPDILNLLDRLNKCEQEKSDLRAQLAEIHSAEPVGGVVYRDLIPCLTQDKWIRSTDKRLYLHPPIPSHQLQSVAIPDETGKAIFALGYSVGHNDGIGCGHSMAPRCNHDGDNEAESYLPEIHELLQEPQPDNNRSQDGE